jgi:hypothetical protein
VFDAHGAEIKETLDLIAEHGQNVGSALKLDLPGSARDTVMHQVAEWDAKIQNGTAQLDEQALHQELRGYLKPLLLLTADYPTVATNPPYMSSNRMNGELQSYVNEHYPNSKRDLFGVFMEVGRDALKPVGRLGMINQHAWMFVSAYEGLRRHVLNTTFIESMLHLGPNAFEEIGGEVVQSTAFVLQNAFPKEQKGTYFRLVDESSASAKRHAFEADAHRHSGVDQQDFEKIPGNAILYWLSEKSVKVLDRSKNIGDYAQSKSRMVTCNNKKYLRCVWEVEKG